MPLFNPGSGTGTHPRARAQRLEMAMGIVGFFALMATIQTVVLEVKGRPAGIAALLLLVLLLGLWWLWRLRRRLDV
jgi:hypothetical protein